MGVDYIYMAKSLAGLSGLPVRVYRGDVFSGLFHHSVFKPDLAILEEKNIFQNPRSVSFYMTDTFLFYGLLRLDQEDIRFVIGPVAQIRIDSTAAGNILRSIGEPLGRTRELLAYLSSIPNYNLRTFLQILCTLHYFLNGEKLDVSDFLASEEPLDTAASLEETSFPEYVQETPPIHNTYELEKMLLTIVEHGRVSDLQELMHAPPTGRSGTMAANSLQQQKYLFVCTATLVTRAAIRGGLERETAFSLSDLYLQKMDMLNDCTEIEKLQTRMTMDFTERVAAATCGEKSSPMIRSARQYILKHINQKITVEELAHELGINRTYLYKEFQRLTGMSTGAYVQHIKIGEAKRLLSISQKPLGDIASYLGYSSQSHFQNVFKQAEGITPMQYRIQQQR